MNYASSNFNYRVRPILEKDGFKIARKDKAYFYKNKDRKFEGQVAVHVDDFFVAGNDDFIKHVERLVGDSLKISKIERKKLRFTGIDIEEKSDGIHVSMEDYAQSIKLIPVFRKDPDNSPLTSQELKLYRKYVEKFLWLSENVRPDLAFLALDM